MPTPYKQPLEKAALNGALAKNPQRYNKNSAKNSTPLGNPPDHLTPDEQSVWFEIQSVAIPGVLTQSESFAVEALSRLIAEYRDVGREFQSAKIGQMRGLFAQLGMTPVDRQKISIEKPPEKSPYEDLDS